MSAPAATNIPLLPITITLSNRHRMQPYCIFPGVICPSCSIRLSLPNIFLQEWLLFAGLFFTTAGAEAQWWAIGELRVHGRSARPRQPWDQRCFWGPNGILMFISTADVREGRQRGGMEAVLGEEEEEESQQRTVSGRLAESWQTQNVFSHVTADYIHSRVGKEQGGDGDEGPKWRRETSVLFQRYRTSF